MCCQRAPPGIGSITQVGAARSPREKASLGPEIGEKSQEDCSNAKGRDGTVTSGFCKRPGRPGATPFPTGTQGNQEPACPWSRPEVSVIPAPTRTPLP